MGRNLTALVPGILPSARCCVLQGVGVQKIVEHLLVGCMVPDGLVVEKSMLVRFKDRVTLVWSSFNASCSGEGGNP